MKFLPKNQEEKQQKLVGSEEDQASNAAISPLLQVDSKGRTPLHLACKEYMPSKQLQRLLFVERNAAGIKDKDGRYPLHVALINNLHQQVVDRLIRAVPDALGRPDCLNCTPMQYAVLKAEYFRDKEMASMTWGYPSTVDEAKWQKQQIEAWDNVKFILETMISRRKPLSLTHERNLLVESVGFYAPPVIVNHMLTVGGRVLLKEEAMSKQILTLIFRLQYPIRLTKRVLKVTSKVLPKSYILDVIRNGLIDHFDRGFTPSTFGENGNHRKISSGKELLEYYRRKSLGEEASLTIEAQEWWDKLRFFIAFASCRFHDDTDDIILHAALTNPESPPGLIEFLCRLFPSTRFDVDLSTDALPLHLACIYWDPAAGGVQNEIEYTRVLNLLMAGDFSLVRSLSNNRLALHHAIISGKPLPFIRTLIALDKKTASVPDPVTRLLPFELAALPEYNLNKDHQSQSSKDLQQLELIFELLRSSPFALSLLVSPKDKEANPLTRHVLHWCYDWSFSGWSINTRRKDLIRQAISKGKIPEQMRQWWSVLKTLIWRAANELDGGSSRNPMCDTPQTREFLLHAALWNASKIPPIAIELIVEVYPASAFSKQPGTGLIPLQIAAQAQSYKSFPFESTISLSSSLEMMTLLDSDGLVAKSEAGQLPLHMAIGSGKTWAELRTMVEAAPETLSVLDPSTGLLPFQQAACKDCFIPSHRIVCAGTTFAQWDKQRPEENAKVLRALCDGYERDKLTTIFELLRAKPAVLSTSGK
jgi:ankyrin repeat protein